MKNKSLGRGDVWLVNLDPTVGREQAKCRPCVIISPDLFNQGPAELAVILPITSVFRQLSWFVHIEPPEGGLIKHSYVICNQIRTVSKARIVGDKLGTLQQKTISNIEQRLRILLVL
jgi:mRNA interferase MazF